jgi:hypothetical protein
MRYEFEGIPVVEEAFLDLALWILFEFCNAAKERRSENHPQTKAQ